jgi:hypothetical protein
MVDEYEYDMIHQLGFRKESDLISSSDDDSEKSEKEDEYKKNIIIHEILKERKKSLLKILNFFTYILKLKFLKMLLINQILEERKKNAIRIQRCFKFCMKRRMIREIKEKEENNFTIACSIKHVKHLELKVYLTDNEYKIFPFHFCKLRDIFVLYIPRTICKNSVFKVNFIADGKIVIDPMYKADYDINKSGMFYNIIDFKTMEKIENNQKEDKQRILKYLCENYKKKKADFRNSSSESDLDHSTEKNLNYFNTFKSGDELELKKRKSNKFSRKSMTPHSALQLSKRNSSKNHRNSINFTSPLKSILRSPNSSRMHLLTKRVSFCEDLKS